MNNERVKTIKELKELIDKVILPNYFYKTNFSSDDFMIDINYDFIIKAKLIKKDNKMVYEFVLDMQFSRDSELTYDEIAMANNIIEILEMNKKFVLSRLKNILWKNMKERNKKEKRTMKKLLKN